MPGGSGGGGPGRGNTQGDAGTTNLGGGGGGGLNGGGTGGSGVVVLVWPATGLGTTASVSAGLTATVDTATRNGYKIYKFTAGTGTITFS
jgi:hypothetical protein